MGGIGWGSGGRASRLGEGGGGLDAERGVGRFPEGGGETPWVPQQE